MEEAWQFIRRTNLDNKVLKNGEQYGLYKFVGREAFLEWTGTEEHSGCCSLWGMISEIPAESIDCFFLKKSGIFGIKKDCISRFFEKGGDTVV